MGNGNGVLEDDSADLLWPSRGIVDWWWETTPTYSGTSNTNILERCQGQFGKDAESGPSSGPPLIPARCVS